MNADELKSKMAQLPLPITTLSPPHWEAWRLDLYNWILDNDPAQFGKCPAVYHTMLVNHWPGPVAYELGALDIMRFHHTILMPDFGPKDYLKDTQYSLNLIHQAYHIQQWEDATGQRIEQLDTIVEFGGGYGAMCLLVHRLGFKGKYIIYDLPEFSLLQEYYLSQFGLSAEWNPSRKPKDVDLFMALYSLSEVEPKERAKFIPNANSFLFLYSGKWEEWDNVDYFQNLKLWIVENKQLKLLEWRHTELTHLPSPENYYSIGW